MGCHHRKRSVFQCATAALNTLSEKPLKVSKVKLSMRSLRRNSSPVLLRPNI
jgi:hypothetical protein